MRTKSTRFRRRPFWQIQSEQEKTLSVITQEAELTLPSTQEPIVLSHKRVRKRHFLIIPSWLLTVVGLLLLLSAWFYASSPDISQYGLVPTPQDTLLMLGNLLTQGPFWNDLSTTLYRMLLGFSASIVVGIPLGIGIGLSRTLSAMFGGIIDSLKYTPISAFIPLSIILFGIGDQQKVAILLLATGPYMAVLTADAVKSTRTEYIEGALTLGASRTQVITRVILVAAAPQIWQAARLALAIAWTYILTAELVGSENGLGRFMLLAERFFNTKEMLATVVIIAVIGWLSDLCFHLLYIRWFRWAVLMNQERRANG